MKVEIELYGAFRSHQDDPVVVLELQDDACVSDARMALDAYGTANWRDFNHVLLRTSVFASQIEVLREHEPLPADGKLAVLPPVSGG